tara:strand:+ start:230 stop:493 length:264 start_codon:yes stop_codon:yes gene_type:complete
MKIKLSELRKIIEEQLRTIGSLHGDTPPKLAGTQEDELKVRLDQQMNIRGVQPLIDAIKNFDDRNRGSNLMNTLILAIDTAEVDTTQ